MNDKRIGIMIPIELMKDKKLDWTNKALLTEILSLHKLPNGCIASNEHFAELLGILSPAASKRITKLKKLGYISTEDVYKMRLCVGRIITPTGKVSEIELPKQKKEKQKESNKQPEKESADSLPERGKNDGQNDEHDHEHGTSQTIIGVLLEEPEGTSHKNITPLPEEPEGTSHPILGVLPEEPEDTSHGNTISSSTSSDIKSHLLIQFTGETQFDDYSDLKIIPEISSINISGNNSFDNSIENCSSTIGSEQCKQSPIPVNVYRDIMNDFFYGYQTWEQDLNKLGLEEFIRRTQNYHWNQEKSVGLIREFFELYLK